MAMLSIVLAEPHSIEQKRLISLLESAGHHVRLAAHVAEIRELHADHAADLCLCTLHLPEASALMLLDESPRLSCPIVVMVDHDDRDGKIAALHAGVDEVLERPLHDAHVLSTLDCVHNRHVLRMLPAIKEPQGGDLHDMALADVVLTLIDAKTQANILLTGDYGKGSIVLSDGIIMDAHCNHRSGRSAFFQLFTWGSGHFLVSPSNTHHVREIFEPAHTLIQDAVIYRNAWQTLVRSIGNENDVCMLHPLGLAHVLPECSEPEARWLLEYIPASLRAHIEASPLNPLRTVQILIQLADCGGLHVLRASSVVDLAEATPEPVEIHGDTPHQAALSTPEVWDGHVEEETRELPHEEPHQPIIVPEETTTTIDTANDDPSWDHPPISPVRHYAWYAAAGIALIAGGGIWAWPYVSDVSSRTDASIAQQAPSTSTATQHVPEPVPVVEPEVSPPPPVVPRLSDEQEILFNKANALYLKGKLQTARTKFIALLQIAPDVPKVLLGLANTEFDLRSSQQALVHAEKAVEIDPTLADPWLLIGNIWLERREKDKGRSAMKKYLELAPQGEYAGQVKRVLSVLDEEK